MRSISLLVISSLLLFSCNTVSDKAKKIINKTGETIGEGSSEFAKGVSKGIDNTFESNVVIAEPLKQKGISFGKFNITNDSSTNKNRLSIYLIFDKDFSGTISAKVFDQKGTEYGRTTSSIIAKHGEAKYLDFKFDLRYDIESRSKFVLE